MEKTLSTKSLNPVYRKNNFSEKNGLSKRKFDFDKLVAILDDVALLLRTFLDLAS